MRNLKWISVAIGAIAGIGAASAADLPERPYTKTPVVADPIFDWSGFYVGGSVGGRWGESDWTTLSLHAPPLAPIPPIADTAFRKIENDSAQFGGYFGYNWQLSSFVLGIEGDIASGNKSNTQIGIPGTFLLTTPAASLVGDSTTVKLGWDASIRARVGVLIAPKWLIYGTAGVAFQNMEISATCNDIGPAGFACLQAVHSESFSTIRTGWTAGGGLETVLWGNWIGRAQYRYADYGSFTHTFFATSSTGALTIGDTNTTRISTHTHAALLGLSYKFGGPVVARY